MTSPDEFLLALTAWREDDKGGEDGMQAVMNSILNRAKARNLSPYEVCIQREQYDAITILGDPGTVRWPAVHDPFWLIAQSLASDASMDLLPDITHGAVSYYALSMKTPPYWAASMEKTVEVGNQVYFREKV